MSKETCYCGGDDEPWLGSGTTIWCPVCGDYRDQTTNGWQRPKWPTKRPSPPTLYADPTTGEYKGEGYTMRRDPLRSNHWVLSSHTGEEIDNDQMRHDLAERNRMYLSGSLA